MNKFNYDIKVIDNFLDKDDYNELSNFKFDNNFKNKFKVYHNEINDDKIICSSINENLLKRLHKKYFSKAIKILEELSPEKINLYDYSDFTIIITKKNSKFQFMMTLQTSYYQELFIFIPKKFRHFFSQ